MNRSVDTSIFELLVDRAKNAMILVKQGRIVYANKEMSRLSGHEVDDIVGKLFMDFVESKSKEMVWDLYRDSSAGKKDEISYESGIVASNGIIIPLEVTVSKINHKGSVLHLGIMKDISDHKSAGEELRKLTRAVENSPSMVTITNLNGIIEYCNPRQAEISGYSREEMIGRNPRLLKSGFTSSKVYKELWNTIITGKEWKGEFCNKKKSGELYWESASISPFKDENNEITHYIKISEDISALKEMVSELRQLMKQGEILTSVAADFIDIDIREVDEAMNRSLQQIGENVVADRCYIFSYDWDNSTASNTHEWCNKGIQPQINEMQNQSLKVIPGWVELHKQGKPVIVPDVLALQEENPLRHILESQGIKSLITVPLIKDGNCQGFIGYDFVTSRHVPGEMETHQLNVYAHLINNVTERRKSKLELLSQNQRLADIIEATNVGTWTWNIQTGETEFNERWAQIIGYTLEELSPISIDTWMKFVHPEDGEESGRLLEEHFNGKTDFYRCEARMLHKNGEWVWVLDIGKVIKWTEDGKPLMMSGTHQDISALKNYEIEQGLVNNLYREVNAGMSLDLILQMSIQRLADAFYYNTCDIYTHSTGDNFLTLNTERSLWDPKLIKKIKTLTGITPENYKIPLFVGSRFLEILQTGKTVIDNDPVEYLKDFTDKKALQVFAVPIARFIGFKYSARIPLTHSGELLGILAVTSISQFSHTSIETLERIGEQLAIIMKKQHKDEALRKSEKQLQNIAAELASEKDNLIRRVEERTTELRISNAELAKAARLKDEFLASMSHELRTPLNSILGLSEALQEEVYGAMNQKQLKSLQTIEHSGRHLLSLINEILDLAKVEAGKIDLEYGKISIDSLVRSSLVFVRQTALQKQLKISSGIQSSTGYFMADEKRMKQILVNLLNNAVKFTPEQGEISLFVEEKQEDKKIDFCVKDTGIGITEKDIDTLFESFVQIDSSLSRQYEGTGLGLALVKKFAELHGGTVSVESEVNKGSLFTVSIPLILEVGQIVKQENGE